MAIRERLIDLEQRLQRLAGHAEPREPLEIRQAVIQRVVDATCPTGRGRRVLPFDRVDVEVVAGTPQARRVTKAVLEREGGLEAAMRRALEAAGCTPSRDFGLEVHYRKRPPAGWGPEQQFAVTGRAVAEAAAPVERQSARALPDRLVVRLQVVKGRAARKSLASAAERINIGRGGEVSDRDGRFVRRNDLAFVAGDEVSDTVSRVHAHIRCGSSGECRVRDDGSAHGTRIMRAGQVIDVTPGNARGVKLQSGDELHLGQAIVRFERVQRNEGSSTADRGEWQSRSSIP